MTDTTPAAIEVIASLAIPKPNLRRMVWQPVSDDGGRLMRLAPLEWLPAGSHEAIELLVQEQDALAPELAIIRAERDEALERERFTLSDGQRMLRKRDILSVCDMPDTCFETDDGVARCGPCAVKLAGRAGVELNQYTVSNPEAMRLRRELAALRKEVERLREALEPLAAMADRYDPDEGDDGNLECWSGLAVPKIHHLREARAALTAEPLGHGVTADDFRGEA